MKKDHMNSGSTSPIELMQPQVSQQELDSMMQMRHQILEQFDNRLNHPMMNLPDDQKALMRIELYLGAGFALGVYGLPLGAHFLKEASAMSEAYMASRN